MNIAKQNAVLTRIFARLRPIAPEEFEISRSWQAGGICELRMRVLGLVEAIMATGDDPKALEFHIRRCVCSNCDHRTGCGYCLQRERRTCVLDKHRATIVGAVLESVKEFELLWKQCDAGGQVES